ncbi:right-handed parallel beta-helix repeat-containing protein [Adhaeribacter swui]|uniref:Right-handed parallel beta-helix repeat-containing protein n=1 Tax=Adhaeribacter swui TaxID=2086471 RepID=A0A7G7G9I5_9BACT|nr:right-handed parallel beta-helix repeat-containing protein [Adhaeribacter swui]QNF33819.1 right-handed parallel beta-helix repeat-containing protein [Adhaeribacter swui]
MILSFNWILIFFYTSLFVNDYDVNLNRFVIKDIKYFGAKGDGKSNDQIAFEKAAAYFNKRGGNGKLIISKGTYLIGKQTFTKGHEGKPAYEGADVLKFKNIENFTLSGQKGSKLKYIKGLKFGSFDPSTGKVFSSKRNFVDYKYAAFIGHCINFENCKNIKVNDFEIDGNNQSISLGGIYGDVGRQLPHYGFFIKNCRKLIINNVDVHHFALDGISIANSFNDNLRDEIEIINSKFSFNGRQGFSWIGGNGLVIKKSSFNNTGKASVASPPGAGVDIEAEVGPINNGYFEDCEFINNNGCGLVADNGDSKNCTFKNCTFWGVSAWSIWINRPVFTFIECNIYGSFVHGFNASNDVAATKFINSKFEDKPFEGKPVYGKFLIESNGRKRVSFSGCSFIAHQKKLCWVQGSSSWLPEEKYQFSNCNFLFKNVDYPKGDFIALIRSIQYKNCTFKFEHPLAKSMGYWLNSCCGNLNTDLGGNKTIYTTSKVD